MTGDKEHFLDGKTIVVAGGGIAGTTFAIALSKNLNASSRPPRIHIFERDTPDVSQQREGYSLSLSGHNHTGGLAALKKIGLLDHALRSAISGSDGNGSFKIWDANWVEKISYRRRPLAGIPASSVRIARSQLQKLLRDELASSGHTIQWGSQCISVTPLRDGKMCVEVQHGDKGSKEEIECDLLVVADGANSKLRAHLRPHDRLEYCGAVLRGGLARFDTSLPKQLESDWGFQLAGDGVSCFYSPVDKHSVVWAVGHMEAEQAPSLKRGCEKEAAVVVQRGRQLGALLQEPFGTIVDHTDPATVMCLNGHDKMPFTHEIDTLRDIPAVFIGDSNHALSPFAGYGANLALNDACDLAEQLCWNGSLAEAARAYDLLSVPRSKRILMASRGRLRMGHSTGWRLWVFLFVLAVSRLLSAVLQN